MHLTIPTMRLTLWCVPRTEPVRKRLTSSAPKTFWWRSSKPEYLFKIQWLSWRIKDTKKKRQHPSSRATLPSRISTNFTVSPQSLARRMFSRTCHSSSSSSCRRRMQRSSQENTKSAAALARATHTVCPWAYQSLVSRQLFRLATTPLTTTTQTWLANGKLSIKTKLLCLDQEAVKFQPTRKHQMHFSR